MDKQTLQYIRDRADQSDTGSIKAVSCPDIRALLDERAALLEIVEYINAFCAARAKSTRPEADKDDLLELANIASDVIKKVEE